MFKGVKHLLTATLLATGLLVGLGTVTQSANASSWHSGSYEFKAHPGVSGTFFTIGKNYVAMVPSGYTEFKTTNCKYKKYGHLYRIIGTVHKNQYHRGYKDDTMYYKKGKYIKINSTSQYIKQGHHMRGYAGVKFTPQN